MIPVIDMNDFENALIELMTEFYGSLEEAINNRGEFIITIRDNATGYLRKKYQSETLPEELPEFNRQVQMAYVKKINQVIEEQLKKRDLETKLVQKVDTRVIADF